MRLRDGSPYLLSLNAEVTFSHKMADKAGMILQARLGPGSGSGQDRFCTGQILEALPIALSSPKT